MLSAFATKLRTPPHLKSRNSSGPPFFSISEFPSGHAQRRARTFRTQTAYRVVPVNSKITAFWNSKTTSRVWMTSEQRDTPHDAPPDETTCPSSPSYIPKISPISLNKLKEIYPTTSSISQAIAITLRSLAGFQQPDRAVVFKDASTDYTSLEFDFSLTSKLSFDDEHNYTIETTMSVDPIRELSIDSPYLQTQQDLEDEESFLNFLDWYRKKSVALEIDDNIFDQR